MICAEKVAGAYKLGHKAGYEEGLDAAREAVAELLAYESPMGPLIRAMAALAVIDALKEKQ